MAPEEKLPAFLRKRLEERFGPEERERILDGYGRDRSSAFRLNPLKGDREETLRELEGKGVDPSRLPWYGDGFVCSPGDDRAIRETEAYGKGALYLQNPSSMLPPVLLGDCAGLDVLDMCAAPGGKTCQIFALSGGRCGIMACEKDRNRAEKLKYNLARQGVRAAVQVGDALKLDDHFRFDRILLDAPCSGSGTVQTGRENTYRAFSEALVKNSAALQLRLLRKAWSLLKRGGELVYSTCSILPEEDEGPVRKLLAQAGAETAPPPPELVRELPLLECGLENGLLVCPDGTYEGFFAVRILKK
jgi:16S rRNA C967 or C1407 C5-methylase (RsmB/RsmF family)